MTLEKSSPLKQCLTKSLTTITIGDEDLSSTPKLIETILALQENKEESILEEESKTPYGLVLKELPNGLKYSFLRCNDTKSIIISSKLDNDMEVKLLGVLDRNSEAFTWSIEDIKGISPSICMHNILMEEDHAPSIEHQRRLNPTMKEVMKKEVLKWLQAGFIYAIFDSPQVSLVQCVSKMGGMTMVRNEKNELLSTRKITRWRVCIDYRKLNKATRKDHYPLPFLHQMLDRLAGHSHYCFLDGYSRYNKIMVSLED